MNRVHFSSEEMTWETPQALFDELNAEFHFTLDVCAMPETAKCLHYYTTPEGYAYARQFKGFAELDAFAHQWTGVCWMNPPYGRAIGQWMRKAYESSLEAATVVCLVPSRTDTRWWHDYARRGEIRYLQGRLRFGKAAAPAPFPSALVIFRAKAYERLYAANYLNYLRARQLYPYLNHCGSDPDPAGILPERARALRLEILRDLKR